MNWIDELLKMLPVIAGMTDNKVDDLALDLIRRGEEEVRRRMSQRGMTREQVLADADATWDQALAKIKAARG